MTLDETVIYTDAAKKRLEELHAEVKQDIEKAIQERARERKYVPGDDRIEVTASDIEGLANAMRLEFLDRHRYRRFLLLKRIASLYALFGVLAILGGLFYPTLRDLSQENPFQLAIIFAGVLLVLMSYLIWTWAQARIEPARYPYPPSGTDDPREARDQMARPTRTTRTPR